MPYYWAGLKLYDVVAGGRGLAWSRYVSPNQSLASFPTLSSQRTDGASLKGTVRVLSGGFGVFVGRCAFGTTHRWGR